MDPDSRTGRTVRLTIGLMAAGAMCAFGVLSVLMLFFTWWWYAVIASNEFRSCGEGLLTSLIAPPLIVWGCVLLARWGLSGVTSVVTLVVSTIAEILVGGLYLLAADWSVITVPFLILGPCYLLGLLFGLAAAIKPPEPPLSSPDESILLNVSRAVLVLLVLVATLDLEGSHLCLL